MPDNKLPAGQPPREDPDNTKGSLEDDADMKALRQQVPHRGFPRGQSAEEIAGPGTTVDSLPGEHGDHGEHSGEDLKKPA